VQNEPFSYWEPGSSVTTLVKMSQPGIWGQVQSMLKPPIPVASKHNYKIYQKRTSEGPGCKATFYLVTRRIDCHAEGEDGPELE
jgi:hypothetical protein